MHEVVVGPDFGLLGVPLTTPSSFETPLPESRLHYLLHNKPKPFWRDVFISPLLLKKRLEDELLVASYEGVDNHVIRRERSDKLPDRSRQYDPRQQVKRDRNPRPLSKSS